MKFILPLRTNRKIRIFFPNKKLPKNLFANIDVETDMELFKVFLNPLRRILGHSDISTTTIYITLANIDVENGMKAFKGFL